MPDTYDWDSGLLLNPPIFPKITPEYQQLMDSGDFAKLEDLLMERLESTPRDIAYFLPAYRALIRKQDKNRASALLELQVENLKAGHDLAAETTLLRVVLGFWPDCKFAGDRLLVHLKTMYADSPNYKKYVQHLQISDGVAGIEKLRQLELWLRYDEGRVVYMPSKGVARINETNTKFGVVRMVFKNSEHLSLRTDEAERLAQSLTNDHFLVQTLTDTEVLIQLAMSDPGELLRRLFASIRREVSLSELQEILSGIVSEPQWSAWWTRARKDSRLIVGSGTKPNLIWNDSISEGSAGLLKVFLQASPYDKLAMLKKHAARSEDMATDMARALAEEAAEMLGSDPSLALEIALSIAGLPQCRNVEASFSAEELLSDEDAGEIIAGIKDRLARRKAIQIVAEFREDWPPLYGALLQVETDTSLFKLMYESLHAAGHGDLLVHTVERTFSEPSKTPRFYLWLCKEVPKRPELQQYANGDFLRLLFGILDNSEFRGHHTALRKFFNPGEAVDRAIESLDAPAGRLLFDTLLRNRDLDEYIKDGIRQKLFSLFPELHEQKKNHLLVTQPALDKKRTEFEKLVREDIPHNAREIQRTREYGDLRENFEYHEARRQQELLSSRAKTLHDELIAARPIEPRSVDTSKISIGTRVSLRPEEGAGEPVTLTILGPWDSDPANNILSYTSAAGEALLNATKGSSVRFNEAGYVVDSIDVWTS